MMSSRGVYVFDPLVHLVFSSSILLDGLVGKIECTLHKIHSPWHWASESVADFLG